MFDWEFLRYDFSARLKELSNLTQPTTGSPFTAASATAKVRTPPMASSPFAAHHTCTPRPQARCVDTGSEASKSLTACARKSCDANGTFVPDNTCKLAQSFGALVAVQTGLCKPERPAERDESGLSSSVPSLLSPRFPVHARLRGEPCLSYRP